MSRGIVIPAGLQDRPHITELFNYIWDPQSLQKAKEEYIELLIIENKFATADPIKLKAISAATTRLRIDSYTTFGEELKKKQPNSKLIKMICEHYTRYASEIQRKAMIEFSILQQVAAAYALLPKAEPPRQNFNKTIAGPGQGVYGLDSNLSQSQYEGHQHNSPQSLSDGSFKINGRIFYPEEMYRELNNRASEQSKDISMLMKQLKESRNDAEELRSRLSGFASKQLTEGNPDFTDLSDKNRPTSLAEKFHMIYDEEWTTALEALAHTKKGSETNTEEEAIKLLMEVIKRCDAFCKNYAAKQLDMFMNCFSNPFDHSVASTDYKPNVPTTWITEFKTRRKTQYSDCVQNAIKEFVNGQLSRMQNGSHPDVKAYASKCVAVMWLMAIQEPPMDIAWPAENKPFSSAHYKEYCKKGTVVKLPVWPAVFLHKDGPLMSKGYVMPI